MSNLRFKHKNQDNPLYYYYIPEDAFIITDRAYINGYCEEHEIIEKIEKNEEGYFDFSKGIVDIGAEDGNYSMLLNFRYNYCFEPNKRSAALIYANTFLKNKVYNTDIYNVALGDEEGVVNFNNFCCEGSGGADENSNTGFFQDMYEVPMKTLDSYNLTNIGFIKIDVEGFEENVLRGGVETIKNNNYPPILFEGWDVGYWNMTQEKHDSLFNFLKSLGYEILEHWGDHETHLAIHRQQVTAEDDKTDTGDELENGFTLVIPLYNKVNVFRNTLDSVLNNHGKYPFKCIIIDDDSTDGSSEIGEEYCVKYPDVFTYIKRKHTEEHKTPVFARNLGIKLADTKYIGFLDADDELCAGFIDRACTFLDENPKYSAYYNKHTIRYTDEDGNIATKLPPCGIGVNEVDFITFANNRGLMLHFCAGVYRTSLTKDCLFVDAICEDSVFQLKYCCKYEPIYLDLNIFNSIIYNSQYSESKNWVKQKTDNPWVYEMCMEFEKEMPDMKYGIELLPSGSLAVYKKYSKTN